MYVIYVFIYVNSYHINFIDYNIYYFIFYLQFSINDNVQFDLVKLFSYIFHLSLILFHPNVRQCTTTFEAFTAIAAMTTFTTIAVLAAITAIAVITLNAVNAVIGSHFHQSLYYIPIVDIPGSSIVCFVWVQISITTTSCYSFSSITVSISLVLNIVGVPIIKWGQPHNFQWNSITPSLMPCVTYLKL